MQKLIIDVSQWQGKIDWTKVKPQIDGAILRMGFGSDQTNQDDRQWRYNVSECERLGIPYGAYFYSYATNSASLQSEINHTLRLLKDCKKLSYPVYFDAEDVSIRTYAHASFPAWDQAIKAAGYKTGLYSGYYFRRECMPNVNPDTWWLAWYNGTEGKRKPQIPYKYDMWQYKSNGHFDGITGRVDTNYCYVNFDNFKPSASPAAAPVPAPKFITPRCDIEIQCLNRGRSGKKIGGGEVCLYDDAVVGLSIGVTGGSVKYRVHRLDGGWFDRVEKCDWATPDAYAGDLRSMIDGVQVYFYSDEDTKKHGCYYGAKYSVKTQRRGWLPWVYDTDWQDNDGVSTAGIFGDPIIGFRMQLVPV